METVFGPPSLPEENGGLWQTGVKSDVSGCLPENKPMSWGPWSPTADLRRFARVVQCPLAAQKKDPAEPVQS